MILPGQNFAVRKWASAFGGLIVFLVILLCSCSFSRGDVEDFLDEGLTSKVFYDANGGSGTIPATRTAIGSLIVLADGSRFSRDGYAFIGWNTERDGSGASHAASAQLSMPSADVTLYAIWTNAQTVIYHGNGQASGVAPAATHYEPGTSVSVSGNTGSLYRSSSYVFSGWNTQADGTGMTYLGGDTFTMETSNVHLYAVWTAIPSAVTMTITSSVTTGTDHNGNANPNYYVISDTITVTADSMFSSSDSFSIGAWFNVDTLPGPGTYPRIVSSGSSSGFEYFLFTDGNNGGALTAYVGISGNSGSAVTVSSPIVAGTWYHAVMTYDGATNRVALYADGVSVGTDTYTAGAADSPTNGLTIGETRVVSFPGTIGDVRIFSEALASDEVLALYNN